MAINIGPSPEERAIAFILGEFKRYQNILSSVEESTRDLPYSGLSAGAQRQILSEQQRRLTRSLNALTQRIDAWSTREIPSAYVQGRLAAQALLNDARLELTPFDDEAMALISRDTADRLGASMRATREDFLRRRGWTEGLLNKNLRAVSPEAVPKALRNALLRGDLTPTTFAQAVQERVWQGDLLATDAAGRRWQPEAYARMVVRTRTAEAFNAGTLNYLSQTGVGRVEVSDGDQDATCAHANGQVWTVEYAMQNILAHPNCTRHFYPVPGRGRADRTTQLDAANRVGKVAKTTAQALVAVARARTAYVALSGLLSEPGRRVITESVERVSSSPYAQIIEFPFERLRQLEHELVDYVRPMLKAAGDFERQIVRQRLPAVWRRAASDLTQRLRGASGGAPAAVTAISTPEEIDATTLARQTDVARITRTFREEVTQLEQDLLRGVGARAGAAAPVADAAVVGWEPTLRLQQLDQFTENLLDVVARVRTVSTLELEQAPITIGVSRPARELRQFLAENPPNVFDILPLSEARRAELGGAIVPEFLEGQYERITEFAERLRFGEIRILEFEARRAELDGLLAYSRVSSVLLPPRWAQLLDEFGPRDAADRIMIELWEDGFGGGVTKTVTKFDEFFATNELLTFHSDLRRLLTELGWEPVSLAAHGQNGAPLLTNNGFFIKPFEGYDGRLGPAVERWNVWLAQRLGINMPASGPSIMLNEVGRYTVMDLREELTTLDRLLASDDFTGPRDFLRRLARGEALSTNELEQLGNARLLNLVTDNLDGHGANYLVRQADNGEILEFVPIDREGTFFFTGKYLPLGTWTESIFEAVWDYSLSVGGSPITRMLDSGVGDPGRTARWLRLDPDPGIDSGRLPLFGVKREKAAIPVLASSQAPDLARELNEVPTRRFVPAGLQNILVDQRGEMFTNAVQRVSSTQFEVLQRFARGEYFDEMMEEARGAYRGILGLTEGWDVRPDGRIELPEGVIEELQRDLLAVQARARLLLDNGAVVDDALVSTRIDSITIPGTLTRHSLQTIQLEEGVDLGRDVWLGQLRVVSDGINEYVVYVSHIWETTTGERKVGLVVSRNTDETVQWSRITGEPILLGVPGEDYLYVVADVP